MTGDVLDGAATSILEVRELRKSYSAARRSIGGGPHQDRVAAVDGITFELRKGETFGVVGESGCGKSTLAETILRLQEPTSGQALFRGEDIFSMSPPRLRAFRRQAQIVFQDPFTSLNPRMTAAQTIIDPWRIHKGVVPRDEWNDRMFALLEMVGLRADHSNRYPRQLSGGQLQRLGIARALALGPDLLICDEPVSSLDVSVQAQVLNVLAEIQERLHLSSIFISHDLTVVRHICDRVAVMYLGRIVEIGPVEEVFDSPRHPYTKALLSAAPAFENVDRRRRIALRGEVPSPTRRPSGCSFHTRCWKAADVCRENDPRLSPVVAGHGSVACHDPEHPDEGLAT